MKEVKKTISILLSLIMVLSLFTAVPVTAGAVNYTKYCLYGYIDGKDVGKGDDYANVSMAFDAEGHYTTTFPECATDKGNYVAVKTVDLSKWYTFDSYCPDGTAAPLHVFRDDDPGDNMYVPGGVEVTFTLVENGDGTLTLSYTTADSSDPGTDPTPAGDKYALCGYIDGKDVGKGDDYANISMRFDAEGHYTTTFPECDVQDGNYVSVKTADNNKWYTFDAYCPDGSQAQLHEFRDGETGENMYVPGGVEVTFTLVENGDGTLTLSYTTADSSDPGTDPTPAGDKYALCGWIDGKDVGKGNDWENVSMRFDAEGHYTTTFPECDSADGNYVSVKSIDNNDWYNFDAYCQDGTPAKLHKYGEGEESHDMYVPGGVEVTFTLVENGDGTLTLSYTTADSSDPGTDPTPAGGKYALCGWIDGKDVGKGDDYANISMRFDAEGHYTTTFPECDVQDGNYVSVKTIDNNKWYTFDAYCPDGSQAQLHEFRDGETGEDMYVPGGVEVTFTLVENGDGTLTLSYTTAGSSEETTTEETAPEETTPGTSDKTEVIVNGNSYDVKVGEKYTYYYYMNVSSATAGTSDPGKVRSVQGRIDYDDTKLKVLNFVEDAEGLYTDMFPIIGQKYSHATIHPGTIGFAGSNPPKGYTFDKNDSVLCKVVFEVISEGSSEVLTTVTNMLNMDRETIVDEGGIVADWDSSQKLVSNNPETQAETQVETQAETQVETQVETQAETQVETQVETQDETQAETQAESQPPVPGGSTLKIDGVTYPVAVGDTIKYYAYLNVADVTKDASLTKEDGTVVSEAGMISNVDASTFYTSSMLEFVQAEDNMEMFPIIYRHFLIPNYDIPGEIVFNASSSNGAKFDTNESELCVFTFKVKSEGNGEISTRIRRMCDADYSINALVEDSVKKADFFWKETLTGNTVPTIPTEAPSEKPTESEPATPDEVDPNKAYIRADGQLFPVTKGKEYTYATYLYVPDKKIGGLNVTTYFDKEALQFVPAVDEFGDPILSEIFPILGDSAVFNNMEDKIKYNYSSTKGVRFPAEDSILFTGKFLVTADSGIFDIDTRIMVLTDTETNRLVFDGVKDPNAVFTSRSMITNPDLPPVTAPTVEPTDAPIVAPTDAPIVVPTEAPTEAPTAEPTEAPTEAPTEKPSEDVKEKVTGITYDAADTIVTLNWDKFEGANKYWVYMYNEATKAWAVKISSTTTTATIRKLTGGTDYQFKVIARVADADGTHSMSLDDADVVTVTTAAPVAVGAITAVADITSADLQWDAVEGAVKYWVYKSTSPDGPFYIYNSTTTTSLTAYKLKPESKYYFKVRVLTKVNGLDNYSDVANSPVIEVQTKSKSLITATVTNTTPNSVTLTWPALENADKYWVKMSKTSANPADEAKWKIMTSTTDTTATISNLEPYTFYNFCVVARYTYSSGQVGVVNYVVNSLKTPKAQ